MPSTDTALREDRPTDGGDRLINDPGAGSLRTNAARGAVITLSAQGTRFTITLVYQIIITRLLTPANFGLVAMVEPMVAFIYMFNTLGLTQATIQKDKVTQNELSSMFWINALFGLCVCLVALAIAPLVGRFYHDPRATEVMQCFSLTLIMAGLSAQHIALMSRRMMFGRIAIIEISAALAGASAAIYAALSGWGYWALVVTSLVTSLVATILAWTLSGWRPSLRPRFDGVGAMLGFGSKLAGFNILNFLSQNLQNVLIGRINGPVQLGFYNRGYRLLLFPLVQILQPIARVAIPVLSRLQTQPHTYRRVYLTMLQAIYLAAVPGVICGIAFPAPIIATLFGVNWLPVAPILFWLSMFGVTSFLSSSSGWLFISQGRTGEYFALGAINAVAYITAFVIGVHTGAIGVARAYGLCGSVLTAPLTAFLVTRRGPVRLPDLLAALWPIAASCGAAFVMLIVVGRQVPFAGPMGVLLGFSLSYATTGAVMVSLPAGRQLIGKIISIRSLLFRKDAESAALASAETPAP